MKREGHDHYKTLICGATLSGIGAALAAPESALVVERSAAVGQEFIESFNPGRNGDAPSLSGFGYSFAAELRQRNLTGPAIAPVHLPGLHPVLCRRLLDARVHVLLLTEILQIRQHSSGFEVELYNASGIRTVTAGRILDTTTSRVSRPADRFQPDKRSLNAYIHTDIAGQGLPAASDPGVELVQGRFSAEHIIKWTLEADDDWPAARKGLLSYWHNRPSVLLPWTIAAIASVFDSDVPRGLQIFMDDWFWLPSKGYRQPVEAIDQGYVHRRRWEAEADGVR
ncbi:hypothetical protein [Paenibacillus borealis]|uniref:Uncharacterized protein n=1 Tax=Paenibacillus borealis TaxID=160799 RepID=A0A089LHT6_PAEBO|nr:hypothetical protein [Paenibacillus borealis]AIQ58728.1 hypothetical protein PBOR_18620 [Paenibacillus borealis]